MCLTLATSTVRVELTQDGSFHFFAYIFQILCELSIIHLLQSERDKHIVHSTILFD